MASSVTTPVGILITVALLALYGVYAIWLAFSERSLLFALAAAAAVVACVATAKLLAWSRYLVYPLMAAFIGAWVYSLYTAARVGYFSLFSASETAFALAPGTVLALLSCFCSYAVFRQFRVAPQRT